MALRVSLAGRVGIEADQAGTDQGLGRPARLAFAYLVCERHRPVPRDELAEVVWGEDLPRSWEQLLRGIVSKLRSHLSAVGVEGVTALTTTFGAYQLHLPTGSTVDVEEAAAAVEAAGASMSANDPDGALEAASAAVAVASRQFLPGGSGPWVERRQAELREVHLRALEALAAAEGAATGRRRWRRPRRRSGLEPFRESAFLRLMAAHAGAGNRGEALRAYERCRRTLAEELGVGTSAPTEAAYLALLDDEPTRPGPAPAAAAIPLPAAVASAAGGFFVGRKAESERLAAAFGRSAGERRQAVLVAGEPGIGKTALVVTLARHAHAEGARVLYGRCDEDLGVAYQPFAEALGHFVAHCPRTELAGHVADYGGELAGLVPQLARRLPDTPGPRTTDPEADRYRLFEAVSGLLDTASQPAPVVLVLDDLHWAASATLLLLRHVLRGAEPARLLVVATYRQTELGPSHPLSATLADLHREPAGVERIVLEGLDEEAVAAFLEVAGGAPLGAEERALARAIHAHTAGNPFFVGQLLRHLAESGAVYRREGRWSYYQDAQGLGVPEGVREVIARRLQRLSENANRALVVAAVIGTEFDLALLEAVLEPRERAPALDAMEEAVAGHLLVEVGHGHYRFSHALVRETIYSGLMATRRGRLHRRVGEALESIAVADDSVRLPALAHHFAEAASAGCAIKAADYALAAAHQAVAQAAWEDAVARLERGLAALAVDDAPDLERRCDLLLLLAETWTRFFHPPRAFVAATSAVEAARALGSPERLGQAAYWYLRGSTGAQLGNREAANAPAAEIANEALSALGDALPAVRAKIITLIASPLLAGGVFDEEKLQEGLALARRSGDSDALGVALSAASGALRGSPRLREYLALAEELVSAAPSDGWDGWRNGPGMVAMGRLSLGDRAGFEAGVAACERLGIERRFWYFRWQGAMWRAGLALLDGRFADVEDLAARARDIAPRSLMGVEFFLRQIFKVRHEQGDLAGAHAAAARLLEGWPHNTVHVAIHAFARAEACGVDAEREWFGSLVDRDLGPIPPERIPVTLACRAELALALGGVARAQRVYEALHPYAHQVLIGGMGEGCMGAADRYLGVLAALRSDWAGSEAHFEVALELEDGLRSPPLLARTRYAYGRMLLDRSKTGDAARAARLLAASGETAESLGMAALAAQVKAFRDRP